MKNKYHEPFKIIKINNNDNDLNAMYSDNTKWI